MGPLNTTITRRDVSAGAAYTCNCCCLFSEDGCRLDSRQPHCYLIKALLIFFFHKCWSCGTMYICTGTSLSLLKEWVFADFWSSEIDEHSGVVTLATYAKRTVIYRYIISCTWDSSLTDGFTSQVAERTDTLFWFIYPVLNISWVEQKSGLRRSY